MSQNLPFINFALSYDNQNVFLDVAQSDVTFPSAAVTANQLAVAQAIESLGAGNPLFNTVLSLPSLQAARDAFNSLSGEVYATTIGSLIDAGHYVEDTMLNRMTAPALLYEEVRNAKNVWAQGVGSWGHRDGNSDTAKVTNSGGGLFIGSDVNTNTSRLGIMAGYSSLQNNIAARQSKMSTDNYHLGVYAEQSLGQLVFRAGGAYSWHDVDTHRAVVFPGLAELLKSDYNANSTQAFIKSGYALGQNSWQLRASASHVSTDSFQEQGGIAALNSRKNQESIYFSTLGGRFYKTFKEEKQYTLKGRTLLGWRHAFNDINPLATLAFDTSIPFTIAGSPIARNGLVIDAGIDALFPNKALTLTLSYTGQVASNVQDHGIRGVLAWRFS